jgi:hypothetical protein
VIDIVLELLACLAKEAWGYVGVVVPLLSLDIVATQILEESKGLTALTSTYFEDSHRRI